MYVVGNGVIGGDESRSEVELEGCVLSANARARSFASRRLDIRHARDGEIWDKRSSCRLCSSDTLVLVRSSWRLFECYRLVTIAVVPFVDFV